MQDSNFGFSGEEINLMTNSDFFKQKNIITQKISYLFDELNDSIEKIKKENTRIPEMPGKISGKISKGENYLGLPYLVLDNPRVFSNKNIFAFRTMFWWGNYFSFTFHISGKYLEEFEKNIYTNIDALKEKNYLVCIHSEQWVHHLEKENYECLDALSIREIENLVKQNGFLKLSRKLDLKMWAEVPEFATKTLKEYLSILRS